MKYVFLNVLFIGYSLVVEEAQHVHKSTVSVVFYRALVQFSGCPSKPWQVLKTQDSICVYETVCC